MLSVEVFRGGLCSIYYYGVIDKYGLSIKCREWSANISVEPVTSSHYNYRVVFEYTTILDREVKTTCQYNVYSQLFTLSRIRKLIRDIGVDRAARVIVNTIEALMPKYMSMCSG